jgi:hypothetical protein
MIIKDIDGGELELTKTRLTEISGGTSEPFKYYLLLKNLKPTSVTIRLTYKKNPDGYRTPYPAQVHRIFCRIGCRTFSPTTFNQIMKAARAARRKSRKKV